MSRSDVITITISLPKPNLPDRHHQIALCEYASAVATHYCTFYWKMLTGAMAKCLMLCFEISTIFKFLPLISAVAAFCEFFIEVGGNCLDVDARPCFTRRRCNGNIFRIDSIWACNQLISNYCNMHCLNSVFVNCQHLGLCARFDFWFLARSLQYLRSNR